MKKIQKKHFPLIIFFLISFSLVAFSLLVQGSSDEFNNYKETIDTNLNIINDIASGEFDQEKANQIKESQNIIIENQNNILNLTEEVFEVDIIYILAQNTSDTIKLLNNNTDLSFNNGLIDSQTAYEIKALDETIIDNSSAIFNNALAQQENPDGGEEGSSESGGFYDFSQQIYSNLSLIQKTASDKFNIKVIDLIKNYQNNVISNQGFILNLEEAFEMESVNNLVNETNTTVSSLDTSIDNSVKEGLIDSKTADTLKVLNKTISSNSSSILNKALAQQENPDGGEEGGGDVIGEPEGGTTSGPIICDDSVSGYVWSPNIGWINLCLVRYDPMSLSINSGFVYLEGAGWSPNVGWIDFNKNNTGPSGGLDPHGPRIELNNNNKITGWARVMSYETTSSSINYDKEFSPVTSLPDEWADGWINFSGLATNNTPYGVSCDVLNTSLNSTGNCSGYAWGDKVTGWVNFGGMKVEPVDAPSILLKANNFPNLLNIEYPNTITLDWSGTNLTSTNNCTSHGPGFEKVGNQAPTGSTGPLSVNLIPGKYFFDISCPSKYGVNTPPAYSSVYVEVHCPVDKVWNPDPNVHDCEDIVPCTNICPVGQVQQKDCSCVVKKWRLPWFREN